MTEFFMPDPNEFSPAAEAAIFVDGTACQRAIQTAMSGAPEDLVTGPENDQRAYAISGDMCISIRRHHIRLFLEDAPVTYEVAWDNPDDDEPGTKATIIETPALEDTQDQTSPASGDSNGKWIAQAEYINPNARRLALALATMPITGSLLSSTIHDVTEELTVCTIVPEDDILERRQNQSVSAIRGVEARALWAEIEASMDQILEHADMFDAITTGAASNWAEPDAGPEVDLPIERVTVTNDNQTAGIFNGARFDIVHVYFRDSPYIPEEFRDIPGTYFVVHIWNVENTPQHQDVEIRYRVEYPSPDEEFAVSATEFRDIPVPPRDRAAIHAAIVDQLAPDKLQGRINRPMTDDSGTPED